MAACEEEGRQDDRTQDTPAARALLLDCVQEINRLANSRADEMSYEAGRIDTSLPFAELRRRSDVTEKAKAAGQDPQFSQRIRIGLPGARFPGTQTP